MTISIEQNIVGYAVKQKAAVAAAPAATTPAAPVQTLMHEEIERPEELRRLHLQDTAGRQASDVSHDQ